MVDVMDKVLAEAALVFIIWLAVFKLIEFFAT